MAYKIQNRTATSRRIKLIKNGGTISFVQTRMPSFVQNDRDIGFCLVAITDLPSTENPEKDIYLTAHPMGVNGRVSLFRNGTLEQSTRYSNLAKIADRQSWFNQQFGSVIIYSGTLAACFTSSDLGPTYRLVFEDDDLDYQLGEVTTTSPNTNPTLIVERYRLAFDLKLASIEISCEGALNETNPITLEGLYQLEIDGSLVSTKDLSTEELITLLEENGLQVTIYP